MLRYLNLIRNAQKATDPDHPLHGLTKHHHPPKLMEKTIFNNNAYTINKETEARLADNDVRQNLKTTHSIIVTTDSTINKRPPPEIDKTEETLPHTTRRRLAQLRADKSPLLMTYLHKINEEDLPTQDKRRRLPLTNLPTL